jgi:23S rRNA (adenine2503-C2)-methyltransferase
VSVSVPSLATKRPFGDVTLAELAALGVPGSAARVLGCLHRVDRWRDGRPVGMGRALSAFVDDHFDLDLPEIVRREPSTDGATKLLLRLRDGATIETVHMPRAVRHPRVTLCLSSQVGCAMGCTFCRTAQMGLVRHLTVGEIVGQVFVALRALGPHEHIAASLSLVFMGMGEPLHNEAAVLRAIAILCEPAGLGLAPGRISVSTAGLVKGIEQIARTPEPRRPCLALSVNATTDERRSLTMPITRRHGLAELRAALEHFPLRRAEKITLEYVLLRGQNDSDEDADRLASFARGLRHVVNLIPWNGFTEGAGASFAVPSDDDVQRFAHRLMTAGCFVTIRRSRGRDVGGACGQLATDAERSRKRRLPVAATSAVEAANSR